MDRKEQAEFQQLRLDVRRLEKIVSLLLQRNTALEKQIRTLKSGAHLAGMGMNTLQRQLKKV